MSKNTSLDSRTHEWELYGIPLDPQTGTHGSCQVESCGWEWTLATWAHRYDPTKADDMSLCLCSQHSRLFQNLNAVNRRTLDEYRRLLTE